MAIKYQQQQRINAVNQPQTPAFECICMYIYLYLYISYRVVVSIITIIIIIISSPVARRILLDFIRTHFNQVDSTRFVRDSPNFPTFLFSLNQNFVKYFISSFFKC